MSVYYIQDNQDTYVGYGLNMYMYVQYYIIPRDF
jgi:hypothetical protein